MKNLQQLLTYNLNKIGCGYMKLKLSKIISIISVVPLIAFYVLTVIYLHDRSIFGNFPWYIMSILFLTVLPISAYGLKYIIPSVKAQGRLGERKLAFIMGIMGYIIGTSVCFIFNAPRSVKTIFLSYLFSGSLLAFINSVVRFKASGHACGISGPYILLLYFLGAKTWYIIFVLLPVFGARVNMGRHTYKELISGTIVGMFATTLAILI